MAWGDEWEEVPFEELFPGQRQPMPGGEASPMGQSPTQVATGQMGATRLSGTLSVPGRTAQLALGAEVPQPGRLLDVQLDSEISPVWSLVYAPPILADVGINSAPSTRQATVVASLQDIGQLSWGAGAVKTQARFDWGAGGKIFVPAGSVQLGIIERGTAYADTFTTQARLFSAWCIPAEAAERVRTYLTIIGTNIFNVPLPASTDAGARVPPFARRWRLMAGNQIGVPPATPLVAVLNGSGDQLEVWDTPLSGGFVSSFEYWRALPAGACYLRALATNSLTQGPYMFVFELEL